MKKIANFLRVILVLLVVGFSIAPAAAESSSGLSIDPRKDYILKPGQTESDKIQVSNLNQQLPLTLTLKIVDFTFLNNSGTPKLMLAQNSHQTTWSLKPFIALPKTITISPGETEEVPLSISVPSTQGAGSYYSAIEYEAAGTNDSNVDLNASGVSLIFLTVSGNTKEDMSLKQLGAYVPDNTVEGGHYTGFSTSPPSEIGYELANKGNIAESPVGSITLQPMYGKKNINISNANSLSSLALVGQSRLFVACIQSEKQTLKINGIETTNTVCNPKPHLKIGRYNVKLDIFYGQAGMTIHEVTGVAHFWYIPIWFVASVLAVILIVLLAIAYISIRIYKAVKGNAAKKRGFY